MNITQKILAVLRSAYVTVRQNAKRISIIVNYTTILLLTLITSCEQPSQPTLQPSTIDRVSAENTNLTFRVTNPNRQTVEVALSFSPPLPESARIIIDIAGTSVSAKTKMVVQNPHLFPLVPTRSAEIRLTELSDNTTYTITATTTDTLGKTYPDVIARATTADYGNDPDNAKLITVGDSVAGVIQRDDNDYFAVTINTVGTLIAYTTGGAGIAGKIETSGGDEVESDNYDGINNNFYFTTILNEEGTYYIKVSGADTDTNSPYKLHLVFGVAPSFAGPGQTVHLMETTRNTADFTVIADSDATLYWIAYSDNTLQPNPLTIIDNLTKADGVLRGGSVPISANEPAEFSATQLAERTEYSFYAVLQNNTGLFSAVRKINFFTRPFFYYHTNGITILCPNTAVGDSGVVDDVTYTKRAKGQITAENAAATCTSGITDMSSLISSFPSKATFNANISRWDTSNVINMDSMFQDAASFNQYIGGWNVANVTNMNAMFSGAANFNQDIGGWNVGAVTDMHSMFHDATNFDQDIGRWNVANVTNMRSMFHDATNFDQDIGRWNVANVTNMQLMFRRAINFNQNIGNWDVAKVTEMDGMFWKATNFNQDIGRWNVAKVANMGAMFANATNFDQDIGGWDVGAVTDMTAMLQNATNFNQDIGRWDVTKVTNMLTMFQYATNFNQNIERWNVANVTSMGGMFNDATNFNQDVGRWNVAKVTDMGAMFAGATAFNQDLSEWCVSGIGSEPSGFDDSSPLALTANSAKRPVWGTCP